MTNQLDAFERARGPAVKVHVCPIFSPTQNMESIMRNLQPAMPVPENINDDIRADSQ